MTILTIQLFSINFKFEEFFYDNNDSGNYLAIFISAVATFIAFSGVRFQVLVLLKGQLADMAKECNKNINSDTSNTSNSSKYFTCGFHDHNRRKFDKQFIEQ